MAKVKRYEEGGDTGYEYEGSEEDAMATARKRMAERDAEYAARQAASESETPAPAPRRAARPVAKKAAVKPARSYSAPLAEALDEGSTARRPSMTAPAVKAVADAVRSGAGSFRGATGIGAGDVANRGLRGLGGGTAVPGMKKGGKVKAKKPAVKKMARGGGCEIKGKTRGRFV